MGLIKRLQYRLTILLLLCLVLFVSRGRTLQSKEIEFDVIIPGESVITHGTLDNRLTDYIRQIMNHENWVKLKLVIKAEPVLEDNDQKKIAHFLEHMASNRIKDFEKQEIVNFLESLIVCL